MTHFSNYAEEAILNHFFRGVSTTAPANVYLGVALAGASEADLEAGTLTDEYTAYTGDRKAVTFTAPVQDDGAGYIESDAQIELEDTGAATVGYTFISDSDQKGAGNIIAWAPIVDGQGDPITRSVDADGILRINAGSIRYRLD